jgi:Raf kinase inhibitor-like YbhB/YbcL family protein
MNTHTKMKKIGPGLKRIGGFAIVFLFCLLASVLLWRPSKPVQGQERPALRLHSLSFSDGGRIPRRYTCDGANLSPQLQWQSAPAGTKSLAIIMYDPDALSFIHWLVWNIPPDARELAEGASPQGSMPHGFVEGRNDFRSIGYGGPCPPPGNPHHYVFSMYALDVRLDISAGATRRQLNAAMMGHVLDQGQIVGIYQRMGQ